MNTNKAKIILFLERLGRAFNIVMIILSGIALSALVVFMFYGAVVEFGWFNVVKFLAGVIGIFTASWIILALFVGFIMVWEEKWSELSSQAKESINKNNKRSK